MSRFQVDPKTTAVEKSNCENTQKEQGNKLHLANTQI